MKTKLKLFVTGILLLTVVICTAQPKMGKYDDRERIEIQKIAFITKKLDLTPEEAQVFWPVYNQCNKERQAFNKSKRGSTKGGEDRKNIDEMSDAEVEKMVDGQIAFRQQEVELQKACHDKYKKVLPIKKVAKLYQAEKQFKRELLRKMRDHREPPHKPTPPDRQ